MGFILSIYRVEFHFLNFRGSSGFRVQMFCLHKDSLAAPSASSGPQPATQGISYLAKAAAMQDAGKGKGKG